MMHKKEWWAVFVVIAIGAGFLVFIAARTIGQVLALQNSGTNTVVDTSGWMDYHNAQYNFDFQYPPDWEISTTGLNNTSPFVAVGNPLSGTKTYAVDVFIQTDPNGLSSGEYVHEMLAADRAQDAASGADKGSAPQVTPQYTGTSILEIGEQDQSGQSPYEAYELSGVYEFDHNADQVYIADGKYILRFDFPVAEENPNISLPVTNNAVVQEILTTLQLDIRD